MLEFCKMICELLGGIDEGFVFPSLVLEVVTTAHQYAMPAVTLGFYMPDHDTVQKRAT